MLDSLDWLFDSVALIFLLVLFFTVVVAAVWLGSLPGDVARRRGHPQADAITVLGWLGILFLPLWPIAFTWAYLHTGKTTEVRA